MYSIICIQFLILNFNVLYYIVYTLFAGSQQRQQLQQQQKILEHTQNRYFSHLCIVLCILFGVKT